jgi:sterol desaturase/sphingolipid hydroxylase (fatty acid hydroxylase superfamily)
MTPDGAFSFKVAAAALAFAALFIAERLRPAAPPPRDRRRLAKNAGLWALTLLVSPLIVLPMTALAADHALWARPATVPAAAMLADLLALDFWAYWVHRAYHRVPVMRRLHMPHHRDEHLDTTTAVRFHAGEIGFSALLRGLPILVLAMPLAHVVIYETLLLCFSLFHHSNLRLPPALERALSRFVVTPSIHWVHHHAVRRDTDSNYAAVLSLWDPVFGTRSPTRRTPDMRIGLEGHGETSFLGLLAAPFKERSR